MTIIELAAINKIKKDHFSKALDYSRGILLAALSQLEIGKANIDIKENYFWDTIHPEIRKEAENRFKSGQYSDSVLAAFRQINSIIKEHVKKIKGVELDGSTLMQQAFSPDNPIITLDDLSTENGKNIQKGFMFLFTGSMLGIRNPNAHSNEETEKNRAIHLLFLASLLMYKFDERT